MKCEKCYWDERNGELKRNPALALKPVDTSSMAHNHYAHISVGAAAKELGVSAGVVIGLIKSNRIQGFARTGKTGQPAYRACKADIEALKNKILKAKR